ncbi:MAG: cysteine desulfurase [Fidelibacterota bacterium]|nr:MAG: cysteine desulfurase [Candidatus Neomarinimicrobiota bacterium]
MKANPITYCDYAATAPLRPEVRVDMERVETELYGNPSSIHQPGQAAKVALERARTSIAKILSAQPEEIIFTSGGTEANNLALVGVLKPGDHVVTTMIEHPSVLRPLERLMGWGVEVTSVAPSPSGDIPVSQVAEAIRPDTRLISVMGVNNETGVANDLDALGTLAAERNILLHTDAVQAFGKLPVHVKHSNIHFLSASAHKIGGPKGVGLLYARQGIPFDPLHLGGSQENQHRGGTENVAGIVGFARAAELAEEERAELHDRLTQYRQLLLEKMAGEGIPFYVNGADGYPGIINLRFPEIPGHTLVINLDLENIAASYGSSCASGSARSSHVLLAMGLATKEAEQSLRISFGYGTTEVEVMNVADALIRLVSGAVPADKSETAVEGA